MIEFIPPVYDITELTNWHAQGEINVWKRSKLIDAFKAQVLALRYPNALYHPNISIRILLFMAGLFCISATLGFMAIPFASVMFDSEGFIGIALLFLATALLFFLEKIIIKEKLHFKSGVSEAFLYSAIGFVCAAMFLILGDNQGIQCLIIILVSVFCALRYLDLLTLTLAVMASVYALYLFFAQFSTAAMALLPFAAALFFALLYVNAKRWYKQDLPVYYDDLLLFLQYLAGAGFLASLNYYVVHQLFINLMENSTGSLPYAPVFWFFTFALPIALLLAFVKWRDVVLLRLFLAGIAAAVFTFKMYFSVMPIELSLFLGGLILLTIALGLIRYLKEPKKGFTRDRLLSEDWDDLQAEAAVYAQSGLSKPKTETNPSYGGGDFGGAGAGSSY